tara:strand:+ start:1523 stop:1741 length:219 start_codon:yes stop_codon:yes gene_type:complete
MKIELTEEIEYNRAPMYAVRVDGASVQWFTKKEEAEKLYELILVDSSLIGTKKTVLKSGEIELSSPSSETQN